MLVSMARPRRFLATKAGRQMVLQVVSGLILVALFAVLMSNLVHNLRADGGSFGFGFLTNVAGFDVNESVIAYSAKDSYLLALVVGTLNTLHLAIVCIVFSTLIGVTVGLLQLSDIAVFGIGCRFYIEAMRNLPKLLILLAVYVLMIVQLPVAREAYSFFGFVYLSNRGINLPSLHMSLEPVWSIRCLVLTVLYSGVCIALWRWRVSRFIGISQQFYLPLGVAILGWCVLVGLISFNIPEFSGFNFKGGAVVSLPFLALAITLSIYHGAQVAEVVRSGITSVPSGQIEAGRALGLSKQQISMLIVLPQALRVMIPPLTNQYLNILKNTSIGLAVGYSDLVSIVNTSINQTFRPVELMLISMGIYLLIGLVVSTLLNVFNRRIQLKER